MTDDSLSRCAAVLAGKRGWIVALLVIVAGIAVIGLAGANESAESAPTSLPASAESARVDEITATFPDADEAAVVLVAARPDGGTLEPGDLDALAAAQQRAVAVDPAFGEIGAPVIPAPDGLAAIAPVGIDGTLNGFPLTDRVDELRAAVADGLPSDLTVDVTGGPAFGADIANSFSGANTTLLAVTALVVAILLILTYRSPVLWLVPLLVIGFADRVAASVGTLVAELTGLSFDGSTSGITSVLVFGAGTNYALLLVSRYREELHRHDNHRDALAVAVRRAAPAILASNATVVLALLTLIVALLPSTRGLGVLAACGLVVAAVFVLLVLPPLLAVCGRRLFWPFVPRVEAAAEDGPRGPWYRIAATMTARPLPVVIVSVLVLGLCGLGLIGTKIGLSQTEQFRVQAESVDGIDVLAAHFPGGTSDPTVLLARTTEADRVAAAAETVEGVQSVTADGNMDGWSRYSVVLGADPGTDQAFDSIRQVRAAVSAVPGGEALVGGSDAQALDTAEAAAHDRMVVIPLVLAVVFAVLVVLLRALVAPVLLLATTVLSTIAALGLGHLVSRYIFGFPAFDDQVPLFAFLFLVALGVDYTIFLVTRTREYTRNHHTADAIVRAVASTGGVITSAGIVLAAVFCVLGVLPLITLTQIGIVVGLGIILDAFVVRTIVVPAVFALVGDRVWWPGKAHPDKPQRTVAAHAEYL